MSINQNIKNLSIAKQVLASHPMAFKVIESPAHLTVYFPAGYQLDGVRVSMSNGKLWAYGKALDKAEQVWKGL